ncbi:unnamed protein product [Brachionus calyciflorus]|uniref:G-protein coupled receptors family 1 profile domain-containing protein n=1 Tax=Brachionus calyciflorus TaxID=104777 RepID=A0A813VEX9_9BILA|nr:unnamed protein product [Brachionus calyciflorus]
MKYHSTITEKACQDDKNCQLLYAIIDAQASLYANTTFYSEPTYPSDEKINLIELSQKISSCPFLFDSDFTSDQNQSVSLHDLCRCITLSFKCDIYREKEKNTIESELVKNFYLILYILLILSSTLINLLTSILLINEHKNSHITSLLKNIFCLKKETNFYPRKNVLTNKQFKQIASLNSISDILIFCLLISHWIITLYVIPNQAYLFYSNSNILDCKLTEFFKAFSVSLSIYSIVAISLQRFFAIKFSQYSCTLINGRLIDLVSFISILSFIKSIGILIKTFLFSRTYRRYLITTLLLILIWMISILIGLYNMSQYQEVYLNLKGYQFYEQNISCKFPKELKTEVRTCSSKSTDSDRLLDKSDIIYMVFLMVIPNIIVLISYSWVCYHIWSHGNRLNMNSFRLYYRHNKNLNIEKVEIEQLRNSVKIINSKISSSGSSSNDSLVKKKNKKMVDQEVLAKMLKSSTTQTIQNYHQFSIKKRNMSVTITTFCMVMCFSLCWAPFFLFPIIYFKMANAMTYVNVKVIIHLIGYSSAIWNPIILIIKSKRFKLKVAKLMHRFFCCCTSKTKVLSKNSILDEPLVRHNRNNLTIAFRKCFSINKNNDEPTSSGEKTPI